jgi:hypothetical protein
MAWFQYPEEKLEAFSPLLTELDKRVRGEGYTSMSKHHIGAQTFKTRAVFFEMTEMLTPSIITQLNEWLARLPCYDGVHRRCIRALANYYETSLQRSSKACEPLLEVHRDNVNDADLTIVLGVTDTSSYCGSMLYVSKIAKDGRVWFNKDGSPSRKSVQGVDVCKGVCVVIKNNVEHYVSALQSGNRSSLVFHMKPE